MASSRNLLPLVMLSSLLAAAPAGTAPGEDGGRGKELFDLCAQCHRPDGSGDRLFLAPAIAGLSLWYVERQLQNFHSGLRGTHPKDVAGLRMYPMSLALTTQEDLKAVAVYAASLPPARPEPVLEGGDPAKGKTHYAPCATCHGPDGSGVEQVDGPALTYSNDWYLLAQLQNFKAGIRGGNPQDAQGSLMRAMTMTLVDEQAMKDVIAYIMTLRD